MCSTFLCLSPCEVFCKSLIYQTEDWIGLMMGYLGQTHLNSRRQKGGCSLSYRLHQQLSVHDTFKIIFETWVKYRNWILFIYIIHNGHSVKQIMIYSVLIFLHAATIPYNWHLCGTQLFICRTQVV